MRTHYKLFFILCIVMFIYTSKSLAQCTGDFSGNLITNGDFESGTTGITSNYVYDVMAGMGIGDWTVTTPCCACCAGAYRPATVNGAAGDHTLGNMSGHYMLIDADGTSGKIAWSTNVTVVPATTYYFSAWISNINYLNQNPSQLRFAVNGSQIGSLVTSASPAASGLEADMDHSWTQFTATWNSGGTSGVVTISMVNLITTSTGNDLALDDITFSSSCKFVSYPVTSNLPDTLSICNTGGSVLMDSQINPAGNQFTWRFGGSTIGGANAPSYTATAPGKYYLCYDLFGRNCPKSDSVVVLSNKFYVNLGPDVTLCNPPNLTLNAGVTNPPVKVKWYRNSVLLPGDTSNQININAAGTYTVEVNLPSAPACGTGIDNITINASTTATPTNAYFCAPPAKNVPLSVSGPGTYQWYANPTGTTLASGTVSGPNGQNFTTSPISTSTTYYVEDQTVFSTGNFTPKTRFSGSYAGTCCSNTNQGTSFTASAAFRLDSVTVFSQTYGIPPVGSPKTVSVTLYSGTPPALTAIATKLCTLNVTDPVSNVIHPYQLYLGFSVPAAGNYYLEYSGGTAEIDGSDANNTTTANYPSYQVPGLIQLTGVKQKNGTVNTWWNDKYLYFYNWIVGAGTLCGRVPVYATLNCSLPVSFLNIAVEKNNSSVLLNWSTSDENNNAYFIVEKSKDGIHFDYVSKVDGHGNSNAIQNYTLVDYSPYSGVSYYRIKQVDFDGNYTYSSILSVSFQKSDELINVLNIQGGIKCYYQSSSSQNVIVQVINLVGQEIYNNQHLMEKGINEFEILLPVASGLYIVNVYRNNGEYEQKKIVK